MYEKSARSKETRKMTNKWMGQKRGSTNAGNRTPKLRDSVSIYKITANSANGCSHWNEVIKVRLQTYFHHMLCHHADITYKRDELGNPSIKF